MNTMKLAYKSIFLSDICFFYDNFTFSLWTRKTTPNSITDLIKTTAEKIKNMASEIANNSTGIISPSEVKNTLNQLGEAYKK